MRKEDLMWLKRMDELPEVKGKIIDWIDSINEIIIFTDGSSIQMSLSGDTINFNFQSKEQTDKFYGE